MSPIRLKIVTDEGAQPVAVQIEYADWLEIQRLLGLRHEPPAAAGKPVSETPAAATDGRRPLRGSVVRYDDPFGPAVDETDWDVLR